MCPQWLAPWKPRGAAAGVDCFPVEATDVQGMLAPAKREQIGLTVVGPESALDRGLADQFRAAGLPIVGPLQRAAALESSKVFSKRFMKEAGFPTARYVVCADPAAALDAVAGDQFGFPVVIKADGLAAGKGVTVAANRGEAEAAVRAAMVDRGSVKPATPPGD